MDRKLPPDRSRDPSTGSLPAPLAAYLAELAALGYQPDTIARHRKRFAALDGWLAENLRDWSELDEAMLSECAR